jgi:hypothetical protein
LGEAPEGRQICRRSAAQFNYWGHLTPGLLTAIGRRDAPSPASGHWPPVPDYGHISLPTAGFHPRLNICRPFGAGHTDD